VAELESDDVSPRGGEREGLPPGFRMRADAHYVDQLSARSSDVPMRLVAVDDIDAPDRAVAGDSAKLQALAQSIAEHGVLQPLLVRRDGARYRLIAGRKRLAAARAASVARVPCLVHSVDEEQAETLARAAEVRTDGSKGPSSGADAFVGADVLAPLADAVKAIQAAATLLTGDGSPMVRGVALDLVRAEAWGASWQLQAAAILAGSHRWRFTSHLLAPLMARVRDGFAADGRLRGIEVSMNVADGNLSADVDENSFVCGLSGAIVAVAGVADAGEPARVSVAARKADKAPVIEVALDVDPPDTIAADRFFDIAWIERPGGRAAAIGAAAARAVAERHGGDAVFAGGAGRGCKVRLTLGRSPVAARH